MFLFQGRANHSSPRHFRHQLCRDLTVSGIRSLTNPLLFISSSVGTMEQSQIHNSCPTLPHLGLPLRLDLMSRRSLGGAPQPSCMPCTSQKHIDILDFLRHRAPAAFNSCAEGSKSEGSTKVAMFMWRWVPMPPFASRSRAHSSNEALPKKKGLLGSHRFSLRRCHLQTGGLTCARNP